MNGIVLINKEKGMTSRDVVNIVSKKLKTKRVGHTGTLDPLATGLLVLCVNEGCKLVELLTDHDKDYIAKVKVGVQTDTYDITGNVIEECYHYFWDREKLIKTLESFNGEYEQTVPIYSSIKVNGKKLYEYARNHEDVSLPKHLVKISNMKLLDYNSDSFTFSVTVSKGTYIRSLINDIGKKMKIPMTMEELQRTRVGDYYLGMAGSIDNFKIIPLVDINLPKVEVHKELLKKIKNGVPIENLYHKDKVMFVNDNKAMAIYQGIDNNMMKSYRVFNEKE